MSALLAPQKPPKEGNRRGRLLWWRRERLREAQLAHFVSVQIGEQPTLTAKGAQENDGKENQ
ncbi:hypothetical protein ER575_15215 [Enterococcus faecalis]|nr:hypothetical protein [Enterococcus faecalis]PQG49069.1 hypothetical protein CUS36_03545 [Enterococcus faecium]